MQGYSTVLVLFLLFWSIAACDSRERNAQTEAPAKNTMADTASVEEGAVKVMAGADTSLHNNSLISSLSPNWTVEEVLRKIPEARITKREAVPNRHIQGQIDSLITIKSDSTIFQFYQLPDEAMLQTATLTKKGVAIGSGIEVGMSAEEVARRLPPLQNQKSIPQTILIRSEISPISIRLRFKQNRLSYIQYDGYVD